MLCIDVMMAPNSAGKNRALFLFFYFKIKKNRRPMSQLNRLLAPVHNTDVPHGAA
jgi:hypothetical protein